MEMKNCGKQEGCVSPQLIKFRDFLFLLDNNNHYQDEKLLEKITVFMKNLLRFRLQRLQQSEEKTKPGLKN